MKKTIALIKGDGIGPEIVDSAVQVLEVIAKKYGQDTRRITGSAAGPDPKRTERQYAPYRKKRGSR